MSGRKIRESGKKVKTMTVLELYTNCKIKSDLRVISSYNCRLLCYKFDPTKHLDIGKRDVEYVWADITVTNSGFGSYAKPIICVLADDSTEAK